MANILENMVIGIGADISAIQKDLGQATRIIKNFESTANKNLKEFKQNTEKNMKSATRSIKGLTVAFVGLNTAMSALRLTYNIGRQIADTSGQFETLQTRLVTLSGSSAKARESMAWIVDFTKKTPFQLRETADAFNKLTASGVEATRMLPLIGDAVSAIGGGKEDLNGVVRAFTQISAKGRVSAEELLQISERGIPALKIMKEELGLTAKEMDNLTKAVPDMDEFWDAMEKGIKERFGGAMARQMTKFNGLVSNLSDEFMLFTKEIGEAGFLGVLKRELATALVTIDNLRKDGTLSRWAVEISDALSQVTMSVIKFTKATVAFLSSNQEIFKWAGKITAAYLAWKGVFSPILNLMKNSVIAIRSMGVGMKAYTVSVATATTGTKGLKSALIATNISLKALKASMMTFLPTALIIVAGEALAYIYNNLDRIKKKMDGFASNHALYEQAFRNLGAGANPDEIIKEMDRIRKAREVELSQKQKLIELDTTIAQQRIEALVDGEHIAKMTNELNNALRIPFQKGLAKADSRQLKQDKDNKVFDVLMIQNFGTAQDKINLKYDKMIDKVRALKTTTEQFNIFQRLADKARLKALDDLSEKEKKKAMKEQERLNNKTKREFTKKQKLLDDQAKIEAQYRQETFKLAEEFDPFTREESKIAQSVKLKMDALEEYAEFVGATEEEIAVMQNRIYRTAEEERLAFREQKADEAIKAETLSQRKFIVSMKEMWGKYYDDVASIATGFASSTESTLSDVLFDGLVGEMKTFQEYWEGFWRSMVRTVTDAIAKIAVEKGVSSLVGWGQAMNFFDIGAYEVKQDQVAMVHQGEMIIPKHEAETFRQSLQKNTGLSAMDEATNGALMRGATESFAFGGGTHVLSAGVGGIAMGASMDQIAGALTDVNAWSAIYGGSVIEGIESAFTEKFGLVDNKRTDMVDNFLSKALVGFGAVAPTGGGMLVAKAFGSLGELISGAVGKYIGTNYDEIAKDGYGALAGIGDLLDARPNERTLDALEGSVRFGQLSADASNRYAQVLKDSYLGTEVLTSNFDNIRESYSSYLEREVGQGQEFRNKLGTAQVMDAIQKQMASFQTFSFEGEPSSTSFSDSFGMSISDAIDSISEDDGFGSDGFGGFDTFEKGGRPKLNQPSIVGEKGWELFIPDQAGTIIPHDRSKRMLDSATTASSYSPETSSSDGDFATKSLLEIAKNTKLTYNKLNEIQVLGLPVQES